MGNTSSTAKHPHSLPLDSASPARSHSRRSRSTAPQQPASAARTASPSPRSPSVAPPPPPSPAPDAQAQGSSTTGQQSSTTTSTKHRLPHRSLRTKKKSLELPDLALALTSITPSTHGSPSAGPAGGQASAAAAAAAAAASGPYRRPQASSPIAIPTSPNAVPLLPGDAIQTRLPTIPTNVISAQQVSMADTIFQSPSGTSGRGRAVNHHMRGAPLQYSSTRSFAGAYAHVTGQQQQQQPPSFAARSQPHGGFVPEDIHSSIPLALRKAEVALAAMNLGGEAEAAPTGVDVPSAGEVPLSASEGEVRRLVPIHIVWRGGGKQVFLLRASDDNWKGKQLMDHEENSELWSTWVSLPPGTHHIRFLVDGVSQTAGDLPTAVDDNGSLANYVAVPISGYTPPSANTVALPPVTPVSKTAGAGNSFFADAGGSSESLDGNSSMAGDPNGGGMWTDKVPWQLECAAEEEEQWLAHGQSQRPPAPAPQHPHAPALPRHLEKLIMNQRPPGMPPSSHSASGRHGSHHGSGVRLFNTAHQSMGPRVPSQLPVTTASGTNLSAGQSGRPESTRMQMTPANTQDRDRTSTSTRIGHHTSVGSVTAVADDGSVLPVPSHVVLHHLGTSAIRNGVLAVADTVRYRKKYITTIYYKPT